MTEKPQLTNEEMINEAYHTLIGVLDMAETENMFNAFQRGDEGTYEKIFSAVSKVGGNYMKLPETSNTYYELQRRLGVGISVGLLDATSSGKTESQETADSIRKILDDMVMSTPPHISRLAMKIGQSCDKDFIKGVMDYVRKTYPVHQADTQKQ